MKATIPVRTVSVLNQREHWRRRADRAREHRNAAWMMLRATRVTPAVPCTVLLTRIAPKPLDDDNLRGALKAVRDGVADWLGVDDGSPQIKWEYGQRRGPVKYYAVDVEVSS